MIPQWWFHIDKLRSAFYSKLITCPTDRWIFNWGMFVYFHKWQTYTFRATIFLKLICLGQIWINASNKIDAAWGKKREIWQQYKWIDVGWSSFRRQNWSQRGWTVQCRQRRTVSVATVMVNLQQVFIGGGGCMHGWSWEHTLAARPLTRRPLEFQRQRLTVTV